MNIEEYIESGILELYVFGLLSEAENTEIYSLSQQHTAIAEEILSIEKAVINLSYSISPNLSSANYEAIREKLLERQKVVQLQPRRNTASYLGWVASVVLMFGIAYQYYQYNEAQDEIQTVTAQRSKFEQLLVNAEKENTEKNEALGILRDTLNTKIPLQGQDAAPQAYASVYINKAQNEIYVDVAGLPEPPEGKVYQVWALQLDPFTPTSIGIIDNKTAHSGVFKMEYYEGPQAFGITLEPTGGSPTPTLDQLYTLGKV
ncbi:anti-sigma factor [Flavobacterium rhizosphaerae]|uniref:Anti-sigma factor n=1 Tax=Flavobacterium rhizosphaerae TaxID=3163298 RepID=A0ABW8YT17_9FLAO